MTILIPKSEKVESEILHLLQYCSVFNFGMQFGCTQLKTCTQFDPKLGFGTQFRCSRLNNTIEYINSRLCECEQWTHLLSLILCFYMPMFFRLKYVVNVKICNRIRVFYRSINLLIILENSIRFSFILWINCGSPTSIYSGNDEEKIEHTIKHTTYSLKHKII